MMPVYCKIQKKDSGLTGLVDVTENRTLWILFLLPAEFGETHCCSLDDSKNMLVAVGVNVVRSSSPGHCTVYLC